MKLAKAAQMLKAFGDRNRLRIVNLLVRQELTATQVADVLRMPRHRAARHLRYLYRSQLVLPRHEANEAYYAVREDPDRVCSRLVRPILRQLAKVDGMQDDLKRLARIA